MVDVSKIWLTNTAVWIQTVDGRTACESFANYPRLAHATELERLDYECSPFGIHWYKLDEDLLFDAFFRIGVE